MNSENLMAFWFRSKCGWISFQKERRKERRKKGRKEAKKEGRKGGKRETKV